MAITIGQAVRKLETPKLLIDLDVVDTNLKRMFGAFKSKTVQVRVHFKSLKCSGLAQYIAAAGADGFLCAKLNEAEVLVKSGIKDILIANQIVGEQKLRRLAELSGKGQIRVCVDDAGNVREMSGIAQQCGTTIGVLVEVDIGMHRCGVEPGTPAVELAQVVNASPGLRFDGLQGYDGHLQLLADPEEKKRKCFEGLQQLIETRRLIETAGIPVTVVTGAGTGTWEYVGSYEGMTEIQPGSFVLMDCAYHSVRPEFGCSLSILTQVISKRGGWYVLDAGSKAISKDFGMPVVKNQEGEEVSKLAEEHTVVECDTKNIKLGDQREIIPAHCCATMNLHRSCVAVRDGEVKAVWPIEASGRYD